MEIAAPQLSVNINELEFDKDTSELTFQIQNNGGGELTWDIEDPDSWVEASPSSSTTTEETDEVTVFVDRLAVRSGYYEFTLTVESNVGDHSLDLGMGQD
ncbi:MAG TPA: hypothetical protein ENH10_07160 [Bacteroidetes bacterium]|nr:hypothetical protein [Bacteroidota bacterium]HEX04915.1 hypothetical protein [Bacteroidota bacterium]